MSKTNLETTLTNKPVSLWQNRDYLLLLSGQIVSTIGTQVSLLAFPLLVLALTGSPVQAGLAGTIRVLPYLFLSLPAGALIDRWNRKRVMILCDTGRALALASIPIAYALGHLTLVQLYFVSLTEGILFVFFNLAETASLPRIVTKEQLPTVTAQNITVQSVSILLGPALGGALYSLGRVIPFLTDAISYSLSVLSLLFIKRDFQAERVTSRRKLWVEIKEGLSWLWHQPLIRFIAFTGSTIHLIGSGIVLLVIVLAQHLHASTLAIGLILAIEGIGSILGAFIGSPIKKRFSFRQGVLGTLWLWALLWPLIAIAPNVIVLGAILAAMNMVLTVYDVIQFSYRLALIPDELQGRVNSVFRLILFCGDTLRLTLIGVLISAFGAVTTVLIYGVCVVLLAAFSTFYLRTRHVKALSQVS